MWTEVIDRKKVHTIPVAFLDMSKVLDRMDKSKLVKILVANGTSQDTLSTSAHIIKYADNLTLTSTTPDAAELQSSINETSRWCSD